MVMEEIGKASPTLGLILDVNLFTLGELMGSATPEQQKKYIPDLACGKKIGGLSSTEAQGSINMAEWNIGAVREGDHYLLNSTKLFQTNSCHASTIVITLLSPEGPVKLIVDMDTPGIETGHIERKMGLNGSDTGTIVFKNVKVPAENLMPPTPSPYGSVPFLDVAAICLGIAQEAYDRTFAYLSQRTKNHKKMVIVNGVGTELAKMAIEIELARNLIYNGGRMFDEGQPIYLIAPMAKAWVSELAVRTASRCIELNGAVGYCEDTGLCRLLRDAQGLCIAECSTQIQYALIQMGLGIPVEII
jgi:alkylation response protein AidB-like acyl-CoA dehydrogenase